MKKPLLFALLFISVRAAAQDIPQSGVKISEETMRKEGVAIVNNFQTAVKRCTECPLFITKGTNNLFANGAIIEVTSINTRTKKTYSPEAYFRTVNGLKCGRDPIYKSMKFEYLPVAEEDGIPGNNYGSPIITFNITQVIHAEGIKGRKNYCDITIKSVTIIFSKNSDGVIEGKIIGVFAERTEKCNT